VWAAAIAVWTCFPAGIGRATPGDLDPTFGVGGVVTTDLPGTYYENANAVLRQPDGKLVVTGQDASGYAALTVIRYLPDGSLDPMFGVGGVFVAPVTDLVQIGQKLALQSDGKVIVLGSAIIRLTTDGQLDPSFGIGGIVRQLTVGGFYPYFVDLERQADDKLVLFGMIDTPSRLFVLVRLDADGNLDPTFGSGGATTTAPPQYADARSLTVQPDGKFVGAGNSILRYLPDGTPDPSFGVGGIVTGDFFAYDVIADPDGKLTTAGFRLRRFNADGTPDQSFGSGGVA
jgi:uncharacterized delta-60 repeat protein